jgi:PKD repeat protein
MTDFYSDDGHLSALGKYVEAIAHYSVIFQADPHGAITSGLYFWKARYSVDEAFAEVVWDLTWPVVSNDPYCKVMVGATGSGGTSKDTSQTSGDNTSPRASIQADKATGGAPLTVTFDASGSTDPDDGDAVWGYGWDFGDGDVAGSVVTVEHTYAQPGTYTARVFVRDYPGLWDTASVEISVGGAVSIREGAARRDPVMGVHGDGSTIGFTLGGRRVHLTNGKRSSSFHGASAGMYVTEKGTQALGLGSCDATTGIRIRNKQITK